jgi:hypothetical protein
LLEFPFKVARLWLRDECGINFFGGAKYPKECLYNGSTLWR